MNRLTLIAELGQTCGEDIDLAAQQAEAFIRAGATHAKFQWLQPDMIAAPAAGRYWSTNQTERTQRQVFADAGVIDYDEWQPVIDACRRAGGQFLTTPFDLDACAAAKQYGLRELKIASGDIDNWQLIDAACDAVGPHGRLIVSTGAAHRLEVRDMIRGVDGRVGRLTVLACTLAYPTVAPADFALGRIRTIDRWAQETVGSRTFVDVGYSDHTLDLRTGLAAVAAGARTLERHVTPGGDPNVCADHAMGVTLDEWVSYAAGAKFAWSAVSVSGVEPIPVERAARNGARRTLYAAQDINIGDRFTVDNVRALRPAPEPGECPAARWLVINGERSAVKVRAGRSLPIDCVDWT